LPFSLTTADILMQAIAFAHPHFELKQLNPRGGGGEGTIHCFHESHALNGYLKGGVLYLIQVLNNTISYLIFQFLQFYVGLCLVLIF
jgi:hypothetical protein